jgi:homoserine kinase
MSALHVRTPCSTSNLGPGFDFLGLALELWLDVECRPAAGGVHELELGEDQSGEWPREGNLLLEAFDRAHRALGGEPAPQRFAVRSEIPLGRGLGSSGAAVAAGLLLGAATAGERQPDRDRLARLGLALEGHPDNSTASLFGGCTLAVPLEGGVLTVLQQPLFAGLRFAVAWPSCGLSTTLAREALPTQVPFADAVENPRRLALLLEGLRSGRHDLLAAGIEERLHVRARSALIPGAAAALAAARSAGAPAATISGSGSALVAIHTSSEGAAAAAAAMERCLAAENAWAVSRVLSAAQGGATLSARPA